MSSPTAKSASGATPVSPAAEQAALSATESAESADHRLREPQEYKGRIKPIWCPGCGNFAVLKAMTQSFAALQIDPNNLSLVSGIGCSSRTSGFLKCYGFHGAHGRALPTAIGVKAGNPRLTVVVVGGDGDGLSIGIGHFPHAVRRNVDITYLMLDNRIYGLTKGQTSPTTCQGFQTKTSPQGVLEVPINPVELAITFEAGFVARAYSARTKELAELITKAIEHKGFSMVHVISPCVTFGKGSGFDYFGPRVSPLPDGHDPANRHAALDAARTTEPIQTGVFYDAPRAEYIEQIQELGAGHGRELNDSEPRIDVDALIDRFS